MENNHYLIHERKGYVILELLDEEIDLMKAPFLRKEIQNFFVSRDYQPVIIDIKKVNFLDSTGVGALVALANSVKKNKGKIAVSGVSPRVQQIFDLARIDRIITVFLRIEDAEKFITKEAHS